MRALATNPAARGLMDDAAALAVGGETLVLTHDVIAEDVHYLPTDPPADVAWKLVAVNLSDLAAKGAMPIGALLGYTLGDSDWDVAFTKGLRVALATFGLPLLGGDTVKLRAGSARVLGLTAIGLAGTALPSRSGACSGDQLWVSGSIGDAGAGLKLLRDGKTGPAALIERYRKPSPRLEAGQRLAGLVSAMMDVSDGLLIDASRLAHASQCGVTLRLDWLPLSSALLGVDDDRLAAATAGDDYELLFAAAPAQTARIEALAEELGLLLTPIGGCAAGAGLSLVDGDKPVPLPEALGFEHG